MFPLPFSELLARARAGDPGACEELFERFAPVVRRRVLRRLTPALRRRTDAADVVQEVFAYVFARLADFEDRGEAAFRAWLFLRTDGRVADVHRRAHDAEGARREVTFDESVPAGDVATDVPGPGTAAGQAENHGLLTELVGRLPRTDAEVLRLRAWESLPFDEVARRTGLASADAARMRYARAIVELRSLWRARARLS